MRASFCQSSIQVLSESALRELPALHERILDITSERLYREQRALYRRARELPPTEYTIGQYVLLIYNNAPRAIQHRLIGPYQIETLSEDHVTVRCSANNAASTVPRFRLIPFTHASSVAEAHEILNSDLGENCVLRAELIPPTNTFRTTWLHGNQTVEPFESVRLTAAFQHSQDGDSDLSDDSAHGHTSDLIHFAPNNPPPSANDPHLDGGAAGVQDTDSTAPHTEK